MAIDPRRVKEIFLEAVELSDEAARAVYLDKACQGDAGLRERVAALLRSHDPKGSFLGTPAAVVPDPDHPSARTFAADGTPSVASDTDPAPTEALSSAADALPSGGLPTTATEKEPLTFLARPKRPDSLGRIGHYEALQILGRGAFGIVFRAFDEILQRVVALKVMAPQLAATSPARKRFLREARSSAQVRHENVVQVYEVAEQPLPYLAMEFIPGETLQQKLDRVGPLDVPETLSIGRQIAEGLAAAHATDLIHRDIKPGNVLLEGGQHKVKITDFGLARAADDASISQSGIIAGTPMYMAPEQALGQTLDQRADLFSLGSVLYQMVAGRPPFRANGTLVVLKRVAEDKPRAIREIIPETPQWLCDIIAKLHAKDPEDRYQSAREVADVLADCEAQLKTNSKLKDFSRIPRAKPQRSGRRKWLAAAAVLLAALALALTEINGITHWLPNQQPPSSPKVGDRPKGNQREVLNGTHRPLLITSWNDSGDWVVQGQELYQRENSALWHHLLFGNPGWTDYDFEVEAKMLEPGEAALLFRATTARDMLGAVLGAFDNTRHAVIASYEEGKRQIHNALRQVPGRIENDRWYAVHVQARGNLFKVFLDSRPLLSVSSDRYPHGFLGLATNTIACFRNLKVTDPSGMVLVEGVRDVLPKRSDRQAKPSSPAIAPFTDADVQRIAALPAAEQFVEVRKALMRRNPGFGFGGQVERKIENGVVTELRIVTDQVTDIAPIRVWSALRVLDCRGTDTNFRPNGKLEDLTPLEGMNLAALRHLRLSNTQVGDAGLATFKDCKNLLELDLWNTKLSDAGLAHFKDCKGLTDLNLGATRVSDAGLVHFHDCKALTRLILAWTQVSDAGLANFKDCKNLTYLWVPETQVGDAGLAHFQDCKDLTNLNLAGTKVSDVGLAHFKDCKNLRYLYVDSTQVGDAGLANFKGMRLMELNIDNTAITDLTPLQGMPLEHVRLTPKNITRGLDILRDMKSLKTIGIRWRTFWPAAEFWQRYDKGEFKE